MKFTGEYIIQASPETVWRALNDPEVLRQSIPGCQTLEKVSDTELKATVGTRIGPMSANFTGAVTLSDLDPPRGYTISGAGSGGSIGNAKGDCKVRLTPEGTGTKLTYEADAVVTGKLASLGARLIDATAKMMAGQFFGKFQEIVSAQSAAAMGAGADAAAMPPATAKAFSLTSPVVLGGIAVAAILLYLLFLR